MSNANKPEKVLRVALRRIQKGWVKSHWSKKDKQTGVTAVCIEGAIYGYKTENKSPACVMAKDITLQVIREKYKDGNGRPFLSIPHFNDHPDTTQEMVEDVMKTALIRAETGGLLRGTEEECYQPNKPLKPNVVMTKAMQAAKDGKFL